MCNKKSLDPAVVICKENGAKKSVGCERKGSDIVKAEVTFFLNTYKSTSVNILSSTERTIFFKLFTKVISVFSEYSLIAVVNVVNV